MSGGVFHCSWIQRNICKKDENSFKMTYCSLAGQGSLITLYTCYTTKPVHSKYGATHWLAGAVLGEHGTQACDLTALIHHRSSHSKHKCGGKPDVFGIDQCPVVTGWMGHNIALSERTPTSRLDCCLNQAGGHTRCVHHHWGMVSNETPVQGPCWPIAGLDRWGPWAA